MLTKRLPIIAFIGLLLLSCSKSAFCFAEGSKADKVKVAYLYKIPMFVKWPSEKQQLSSLNLCVLGEDPFNGTLEYLKNRKVQNQVVDIHYVKDSKDLDKIKSCQIAYISSMKINEEILQVIHDNNILTISDNSDFIHQGGMIELRNNLGKINLNINLKSTNKANIKVRSNLLKIAREVVQD